MNKTPAAKQDCFDIACLDEFIELCSTQAYSTASFTYRASRPLQERDIGRRIP
jgi:hypothetical protein